MQRRLVVLALVLFAALGVSSSVALAGGGNSAIAKLCQKNGWQQLQTATGGSFASQTACVSYGATGGSLRAPTLTATDDGCVFYPFDGIYIDTWTLSATGFTPNSSLTIDLQGTSGPWPFPFDNSGSITLHVLDDTPGETVSVTYTDGDGVHASVTFGPTIDCST
jgi:hypothetical protein